MTRPLGAICHVHVPIYRSYRGGQIPEYNVPPGVALLERSRGGRVWRAWTHVSTHLATSMPVLLTQRRRLYLSIHEVKLGRHRWIQRMSLQTTDPATE